MADCGSCTECCKAIHVNKSINNHHRTGAGGDVGFILSNWKRITPRQAKKRNPHIFNTAFHGRQRVQRAKREMQFFKCPHLIDNGCGVYESRPEVCRGYPWYGADPKSRPKPVEYTEDCVYLLELSDES